MLTLPSNIWITKRCSNSIMYPEIISSYPFIKNACCMRCCCASGLIDSSNGRMECRILLREYLSDELEESSRQEIFSCEANSSILFRESCSIGLIIFPLQAKMPCTPDNPAPRIKLKISVSATSPA